MQTALPGALNKIKIGVTEQKWSAGENCPAI